MTRVNLIKPEQLSDQHLFAEWRELKMIATLVKKNLSRGTPMENLPKRYTMSTGHVRFFFDKMFWLCRRHLDLKTELLDRKYNLSEFNTHDAFLKGIPEKFRKFWIPSKEEYLVNVDRVVTRLKERPNWYRFRGEVKPPEFFERMYEF